MVWHCVIPIHGGSWSSRFVNSMVLVVRIFNMEVWFTGEIADLSVRVCLWRWNYYYPPMLGRWLLVGVLLSTECKVFCGVTFSEGGRYRMSSYQKAFVLRQCPFLRFTSFHTQITDIRLFAGSNSKGIGCSKTNKIERELSKCWILEKTRNSAFWLFQRVKMQRSAEC